MKNNKLISSSILACCMMIFCISGVLAQGTTGTYPGQGIGYDSGCGYGNAVIQAPPGSVNPGVVDMLTGGCGNTYTLTTTGLVETATGFDITGFELNNYDIDQASAYGFRIFYGPQDNCGTICLDAMLDLTQGSPCGQFGPQGDLLFSFGYPVPADYGEDIFGNVVIPYANMCPNTEYFVQYQHILASAVDLTDPDGNLCAMDDNLITQTGTISVGTVVAPGTRSSFEINAATFTPIAPADCALPEVLLELTLDVTSGCTVSFGPISKGLEVEVRGLVDCADGTMLDLSTGPLINFPDSCYVGVPGSNEVPDQLEDGQTVQISLGSPEDVCALLACNPGAELEIYAYHTFCEADDINGDGSGVDEAVLPISIADILANYGDAGAMCCAVVCPTATAAAGTPTICSGETVAAGDITEPVVTDPDMTALNTVYAYDEGTAGDPTTGTPFVLGTTALTNTTCAAETTEVFAYIECDDTGDGVVDSYVAAGSFTVTVNPATQIPTDPTPTDCTVTLVPVCPNDMLDAGGNANFNTATGEYTAQPGDAAGTLAVTITNEFGCDPVVYNLATPACAVVCDITPGAATAIVCDDNGTPFDDTDDTFSFDVLVNGNNNLPTAAQTFSDDQGGTGIAYGTTITYGPFPISAGTATITFTDSDTPTCTNSVTATAPATCSDATCEVTPAAAANIVCDDNGTPFDDTDDTFTFDITVTGSNTAMGASNTFNDDQGNAAIAYGTTLSYGPFPISGGNITVTFTDADAPASAACTATMMGAAPATCSDATCTVTPDAATNVVCNDNGTPADPTDDTFTFDITVNGDNTDPAATDTYTDSEGNTGAYGSTQSYGPYDISAGPVTITFTDNDAPVAVACEATMMANPPATCSGATCTITPDAATNIVCNDNGTPGDPADDTYTFDITVNGNSTFPGATQTFNDDQGNAGITYGTTISYGPFPISGGNVTVNFTDADEATCNGSMMATVPATCSDAVCEITPDAAINIVCNDNGTAGDPADDTYTFDITVNGNNTFPGATNTFSDDQGNAGITYGTTVSYGPFPISGGDITVNFTDTETAACTSMMMAAAPATCSGATCAITPDVATNIVCDDNGTAGDPTDDTYTFDITVNGNNTFPGATNTFSDDQGNAGITYGTTVSYGPFPISGGDITVNFTDTETAACTASMMAAAPATCSGATCTITPDAATNIVCDNNGTAGDPTDDTYTFDITVNGSSTFPGATQTFNDDQGNAGITYGTTVSYGPFPISGGNVTVNFTDADEATCTGMMMAAAPATCSDDMCTLTPAQATNIVCNDNGTPADPADDTYTFDITVTGSNPAAGATQTFNDDQGNAGIAYGTTVSYGPYPISGGNTTVNFTDADDPACTGMMMAAAPATCSNAVLIAATDPCNCFNGIDLDGNADNGNELAQEVITITSGVGPFVFTATDGGLVDASGTPFNVGDPAFVFTGNTFTAYVPADGVTPYSVDITDQATGLSITVSGGLCGPCPNVQNVPTLGEWSLIILGLLMVIIGVVGIRQREEIYA